MRETRLEIPEARRGRPCSRVGNSVGERDFRSFVRQSVLVRCSMGLVR